MCCSVGHKCGTDCTMLQMECNFGDFNIDLEKIKHSASKYQSWVSSNQDEATKTKCNLLLEPISDYQ